MAESVNVTSAVLGKKMESFGWDKKNYAAEGELTITITLDEYRHLVASDATKQYDIAKANEDKYKREDENRRLKEEVDSLRQRLYGLQQLCAEKEVTTNA